MLTFPRPESRAVTGANGIAGNELKTPHRFPNIPEKRPALVGNWWRFGSDSVAPVGNSKRRNLRLLPTYRLPGGPGSGGGTGASMGGNPAATAASATGNPPLVRAENARLLP